MGEYVLPFVHAPNMQIQENGLKFWDFSWILILVDPDS